MFFPSYENVCSVLRNLQDKEGGSSLDLNAESHFFVCTIWTSVDEYSDKQFRMSTKLTLFSVTEGFLDLYRKPSVLLQSWSQLCVFLNRSSSKRKKFVFSLRKMSVSSRQLFRILRGIRFEISWKKLPIFYPRRAPIGLCRFLLVQWQLEVR